MYELTQNGDLKPLIEKNSVLIIEKTFKAVCSMYVQACAGNSPYYYIIIM